MSSVLFPNNSDCLLTMARPDIERFRLKTQLYNEDKQTLGDHTYESHFSVNVISVVLWNITDTVTHSVAP